MSYQYFYHGDNGLRLVFIRTGTQPFNGYPWYYYGFTRSE